MIVKLAEAEWFPIYVETDGGGLEVDVPDELLREWRKAHNRFADAQIQLECLYLEKEKELENVKRTSESES